MTPAPVVVVDVLPPQLSLREITHLLTIFDLGHYARYAQQIVERLPA